MFTLTEALKIQVSESANGGGLFDHLVLDFKGQEIHLSQRRSYNPEDQFVIWHSRRFFQGLGLSRRTRLAQQSLLAGVGRRGSAARDTHNKRFAADLWQLYLGEGSREYKEPGEFFRRTYITEGLRSPWSGTRSRPASPASRTTAPG